MFELRPKKKLSSRALFILRGLIFILLILVFLSSGLKSVRDGRGVLTFFQNILYPFEYAFDTGSVFVRTRFDRYLFHVSLAEENEKLREENTSLRTKLLSHRDLEGQIVELRRLLKFSESFPKEELGAARVVGRFKKLAFEGVRLARGKSGGVLAGMPVVSSEGVVGKVIRASYGFSDVLLLTDANFVLDVMIQRTRYRALLKGYSGGQCYFEVPKRLDLKVGDTLVTSGLLDLFPKGLPVGVVTKIELDREDTIKSAIVRPFSEVDSLESVYVLKSGAFSKKEALEESQSPNKKS